MLTYSFYENDGRVKRYAETLAGRGDWVDVISLKKPNQPTFETTKGVNIYRIQERTNDEKGKFSYLRRILRFLLHSFLFLAKLHYRTPYRLIHVHSIPDFEVFAGFWPKLAGCKLILDIHDIVPELFMSKFGYSGNGFLYKTLVEVEKYSCKFADHIIISNHIWEEKLLSRSVPRNKCSTFLNYPDPSIFYRRNKSRTDKKYIMMYPGTLNWHQGLDIAIKSFGRIADQVPEAEMHIYGRGSELVKLKEMVNSDNINDKVLFRDPQPIEQIAELMAEADLGIIPKRNDPFGGEAFSTKSLEFMSLGVPVIMSETRIDKYYFNESVVRFFEPENIDDLSSAMLEMIRSPEKRARLLENALMFAKDYSWEKKKQEYIDLVNSLTSPGN
jgi:glycosyltransferase involved in cell wall biosynthesis